MNIRHKQDKFIPKAKTMNIKHKPCMNQKHEIQVMNQKPKTFIINIDPVSFFLISRKSIVVLKSFMCGRKTYHERT